MGLGFWGEWWHEQYRHAEGFRDKAQVIRLAADDLRRRSGYRFTDNSSAARKALQRMRERQAGIASKLRLVEKTKPITMPEAIDDWGFIDALLGSKETMQIGKEEFTVEKLIAAKLNLRQQALQNGRVELYSISKDRQALILNLIALLHACQEETLFFEKEGDLIWIIAY